MSDTYDNSRPRDTTDDSEAHDTASGGSTAPDAGQNTGDGHHVETILHEERLAVGTEIVEAGSVRARKHVETHPVEYSVPREVEHVDTSERIAVNDDEADSGEVEVLDDGSVSIPVFEEVLVVTKRLVVRERVIVRKHTVVDEYKLQTDLRREHISFDADDSIDLVDDRDDASGTQPEHPEPHAHANDPKEKS